MGKKQAVQEEEYFRKQVKQYNFNDVVHICAYYRMTMYIIFMLDTGVVKLRHDPGNAVKQCHSLN